MYRIEQRSMTVRKRDSENKVWIWVSRGVSAQPFTSDTLQIQLPSRAVSVRNANNFFFFFLNGSTFWPLPADVEVNSWNTATCAFKSSTPRIEQQLWGDIRTSSYNRMWIIAYQQISSKWNHSKWWKYQNEWMTLCTRNEMIWKNKTSLDCQDSRDILRLTKNTCIQGVILRFMWPVPLRFEEPPLHPASAEISFMVAAGICWMGGGRPGWNSKALGTMTVCRRWRERRWGRGREGWELEAQWYRNAMSYEVRLASNRK